LRSDLPADIPGEPAQPEKRERRTGRNLPAAVIVGLGLGGLAILTLFTVKATFLALVGVMVGIALWELARAVADMGMHLGEDYAAATVRSLTEQGMAERTPAASLGKYRITAHGRAWLTSHTSSQESQS